MSRYTDIFFAIIYLKYSICQKKDRQVDLAQIMTS